MRFFCVTDPVFGDWLVVDENGRDWGSFANVWGALARQRSLEARFA